MWKAVNNYGELLKIHDERKSLEFKFWRYERNTCVIYEIRIWFKNRQIIIFPGHVSVLLGYKG